MLRYFCTESGDYEQFSLPPPSPSRPDILAGWLADWRNGGVRKPPRGIRQYTTIILAVILRW